VNAVLVISGHDNVGTALEPLDPGATVHAGTITVLVRDHIPRGHKIALQPIAVGAPVVKYGSAIGSAASDIEPGAHVHTHNLASGRGRGDLSPHAAAPNPTMRTAEPQDADA
jgi:SAF domain